MRLQEYENQIKLKISKNSNDETIYEDLQSMINIFLRRKKACRCSKDYDDMSHIIAADIFLKIVDEGWTCDYLLGYLEKACKKYCHEYYDDMTFSQIPFEDYLNSQLTRSIMSSSYQYRCVENKIYLSDIVNVIDEVLSTCKYKSSINLKLSLIISLMRKEIFSFHLDKEKEAYLKILIVKFYSRVIKQGLEFNDNEVT